MHFLDLLHLFFFHVVQILFVFFELCVDPLLELIKLDLAIHVCIEVIHNLIDDVDLFPAIGAVVGATIILINFLLALWVFSRAPMAEAITKAIIN